MAWALLRTTNGLLNSVSTAKVAHTLLDDSIQTGATCFNTYDASYAAVACQRRPWTRSHFPDSRTRQRTQSHKLYMRWLNPIDLPR